MPPGSKKRRNAAAKKKKGSGTNTSTNNTHQNNNNNDQQPETHGDDDLKHQDGKESEGEDGGSPSSHDLTNHQHQFTDEEKEDSGRTDDDKQVQSIAVENKSAEETRDSGASVENKVLDNSIASEESLEDVGSQKDSGNGVVSHSVNEEAVVQIEIQNEPSEKLEEISAVQDTENGTESSEAGLPQGDNDESYVRDQVNVVVDNSPFASSTEAANMLSEGLTQVTNVVTVGDAHGSVVESGKDNISGDSGPVHEQVGIDTVTSEDSSVPVSDGIDENGKRDADALDSKENSSLAHSLEDQGFADNNDEAVVVTNAAIGVPDANNFVTQESKDIFLSDNSGRNEVANVGSDSIKNLEVNESSDRQPLLGSAPQPVQKTSWMSCCGIFDVLAGSSR